MTYENKVLLLNGPNLNLLGGREPHIYGATKLQDIEQRLATTASAVGSSLKAVQSNHEGTLIDEIHLAMNLNFNWIILNPGGFTHTSVALRDAVIASQIPMIEVHISQVFQRESFRHHSYFSDIATARLVGFGTLGYDYALAVALN